MIHIANPSKPGGGGKRVARFTVGTATAGWTAADCDYLCDGTDDQVEINAAIQALPATGGEVVILDGTYNITAKIAVNKNYTTLTGNGKATVLKRMWSSNVAEGIIHVTSSGNTIQKLMVDGNKKVYNSINNCGICLSFSSNSFVTGNTCNNNYFGIYLSSSSNSTVTGNMCSNSYGIYLLSSHNITITENTCSSNNYGIYLLSSYNITITGNMFSNNSYGIYLSTSSNSTVTGNTCIRGTGLASDYGSTQYTIYLYGTNNKYNLIAYNLIMGKNYTSEGGTGNTFTGNKYN